MAAALLGRKPLASGFNGILSGSASLMSHCSSRGYRCCTGRSTVPLPTVRIKWLGDLENLKHFMAELFDAEGVWSSPGGSAKVFLYDDIKLTWYADNNYNI